MAAVLPPRPPVVRRWGLTGWWALAYVAILAWFVMPVLVAGFINRVGWLDANLLLVGLVFILIDLPLLLYPWPAIGISIVELGRRLARGEAVDSWVVRVYRVAAMTIIARSSAIVVLGILPIKHNGIPVAIFLGLIGLVFLGNLLFSKGSWVIERLWQLMVLLLIGALVYWAIVTIWPGLRHSAANKEVNQAEQEILTQNDLWLKEEAARIRKLLAKMPRHLSPEQRVEKLSRTDQAIWAKAQRSSFGEKSIDELPAVSSIVDKTKEKLAPAVEQAKGAVEGFKEWVSGVTTGPGGCLTSWAGVYEPKAVNGPMSIGNGPFCTGKYRYEMRGKGVHQQAYRLPQYGDYTRFIDCDGNNPETGQEVHSIPEIVATQAPLPKGVAHGTCFLRVKDGPVVAIGKGMEFTLQDQAKLEIGKNVIGQGWDYNGPGQIHLTITKL